MNIYECINNQLQRLDGLLRDGWICEVLYQEETAVLYKILEIVAKDIELTQEQKDNIWWAEQRLQRQEEKLNENSNKS